jgi:hypothetical protein
MLRALFACALCCIATNSLAQSAGCFVEFDKPTECYEGDSFYCFADSAKNHEVYGSAAGSICDYVVQFKDQADSCTGEIESVQKTMRRTIDRLKRRCGSRCRSVRTR